LGLYNSSVVDIAIPFITGELTMQRIIVIVVLSVLTVVESGCDKIKTELERRHLGSASQKETTHSTSQTQKTLPIKLNDG
jgi:hypothetical protein